jgi:hypothetical protein
MPRLSAVLLALLLVARTAAAQTAPMKIVVIAGEDAVNVVQQKTAVAPVVEVRDRNDQPVAGATVRFAISKGRATFNGARTVAVNTDSAGRATAVGFTPTGTGPLLVSATTTVNGQTSTATISQVIVATAAQAASIAAAGGVTGGGGLSGARLGRLSRPPAEERYLASKPRPVTVVAAVTAAAPR